MKPKTFDAIRTICPTSKFVVSSDGEIISSKLKNGETLPTESAIQTKLAELISAWEAQEYARNRASEYPAIADQLDEIYHNGIDSWKAVIKVTKDKYPK